MYYGPEIKQDMSGNHRGLVILKPCLTEREGKWRVAGRALPKYPTKKRGFYRPRVETTAPRGENKYDGSESLLRCYIRAEIFLGR